MFIYGHSFFKLQTLILRHRTHYSKISYLFIKHLNAYSCFRHYFNICAFHSLCVFYLGRKPRIIYNIFMGIMILSAIQSQWYISVCHKFLSRMNLRSHNLNHTWIAFDEERSTLLSLSMKDISIRQYWNKEQNSCRSSTLDFYMISFFEWKRHQYTK